MFSFFLQRSNYAINKSCCEIIFLFSFHFETRRVYIANIDMILKYETRTHTEMSREF
jgi:hypothetical protein